MALDLPPIGEPKPLVFYRKRVILKVSGGSGLTAARQLTSAGLHAARQVACGEVSTLVIVAAGVVVVFAS